MPRKAQKSTDKIKINTSANITEIAAKSDTDNFEYRCSCCGKTYRRQDGNFPTSLSPIYKGNNGYLTTCRRCLDALFEQYTGFYSGNQVHALERICQIFDIYFDEKIWESCRIQNTGSSSRVPIYLKQLNLARSKTRTQGFDNTTYSDTLKRRWTEDLANAESFEQAEGIKADDNIVDSTKMWGLGFKPQDYANLDNMYNEWVEAYGVPEDMATNELYKTLCMSQLNIRRASASGDGNIGSLIKTFQSILNDAGLNPKNKDDKVKVDPLGVWIADIEQYTPADYFKNKKLHADYDGIGSYIQRFLFRPFRNTFLGTNDKDSEFVIDDTEDDSEV